MATHTRLKKWVHHPMGNEGAALVYLISAILLMSVLGGAVVNLSTTATVGQVSANHTDRAYFMAEAGLHFARLKVIPDIEADAGFDDNDADGPIHNQTFTVSDGTDTEGSFTITVDDSASDQTVITSEGSITAGLSGAQAQTSLTLVFIKEIHEGDTSVVSSALYSGSEIILKDNVIVNGDVTTNDEDISQADSATVNGTINTEAEETKDAVEFDCETCDTDETITEDTTWSDQTLEYNNLTVRQDTTVNIEGNVTLYVAGNFAVQNEVTFNFTEGAKLEVYVDGATSFDKNFTVTFESEESEADSFVIYASANVATIAIHKEADFTGVIYAPESDVIIAKDSTFSGGLSAETITVSKDSTVNWESGAASVSHPDSEATGDTATLTFDKRYFTK